jgi:LemA protein
MRLALFKKGQAAGLPAPVVGVLVNAAEAIKHGLGCGAAAYGVMAAGALILASAREGSGSWPGGGYPMRLLQRLRSLAVLALIAVSVSACGYNVIPTKQEAANAAWAEVQNQYQRRSDLVPNLVATVQGFAKQEKDVFVQVTEARAKATSIHLDANDLTDPAKVKQLQDAQNALSGALGRLLAVSENYPDLKSNANFLALQSQLEGTENRIAVARRDYIAAVQDFNTTLRTFPSVLWAQTVFRSIKPLVPFTADSEAQAAPKVKF